MRIEPINPLAGRHVLVLHPRDPWHPRAAGPERYLHQIVSAWARAGVQVTWFAERSVGPAEDGIRVVRAGGHPAAAARMLVAGPMVDAVLTAEDTAFPRSLCWPRRLPVVRVVHDPARLPVPARRHPGEVPVAVSPSVRRALGAGFVVPPGAEEPGPFAVRRDPDPTVVVDLGREPEGGASVLRHIATAARRMPSLHAEVIGGGPALPYVRRVAHELGLAGTVSFHGALAPPELRVLLSRAWLVLPATGGWSAPVLDAAARGVPCLVPRSAAVRDAVADGTTGRVVPDEEDLGPALASTLTELADGAYAASVAAGCQTWARRFAWDRTARLVAAVTAARLRGVLPRGDRRTARQCLGTVARFTPPVDGEVALRVTDESVTEESGEVVALLRGCDEVDAQSVLRRQGATVAEVRLATDLDLLTGPYAEPEAFTELPDVPGIAVEVP